jgi:hypothetical protein
LHVGPHDKLFLWLRNGTEITSRFSGNMISSPWVGA